MTVRSWKALASRHQVVHRCPPSLPLDHAARAIVASVAPRSGLSAYLAALVDSPTHVGYDGYLADFRAAAPSATFVTVQRVMRDHGWYQFDPFNDPVHFSFGRIG